VLREIEPQERPGHVLHERPGLVSRRVVHRELAGLSSEFTVYHSARNQTWTFVKNMPGPLLWLYLPQHLLLSALIVLRAVPQRRTRAALAGKRDAVRGLQRVLRQRRRIQANRRVGALEVRRTMSRGLGVYFLPLVLSLRARRRAVEAAPAVLDLSA